MAKCETCDSVHWQRQQSSVQVREPETGVEKVKRKWLQRTGPQVYAAWLRSRFGFATFFEFSFMNGSSFEPMLGSFWSRMLRGCVPDSVSLRFEFSFMNGSSFELCSDHFGVVAMLAVRQELESQVQQAR